MSFGRSGFGSATRRRVRLGVLGGASTPAAVLPASGLMGAWYADQYSATPKPHIPNAASAVAGSSNLWNSTRRVFTGTQQWLAANGCTATDISAVGPDGLSEASRIVGLGTLSPKGVPTAGTYTAALYVKSNTGVSQNFKIQFATNGIQQTFTATTSWQRFSKTAVCSQSETNFFFLRSPDDGVTAIDLLICDACLFSGSSDLGADVLAGHMGVGADKFDAKPTYAGGELNLTTNFAMGIAQFPTATTFSTITAMAVVSKTAAGPAGLDTFISAMQATMLLDAYSSNSSPPEILDSNFGGSAFASSNYIKTNNLWTFLNAGYHCVTIRYDGTKMAYFLDDILIFERTQAITPPTISDFGFGVVSKTTTSGLKFNSVALWNRNLSNAEVRTAYSALAARAALSSLSITAERIVTFEGDSIPGGSTSTFPHVFGTHASPAVHGANYAVSGSTLTELTARAAALDAVIPPNKGSRKFILTVLIGHNDLIGNSFNAGAFTTALATYLDARRAAGWLVVICTVLPSTVASFNAARNTANTTIRTWVGTHCDALCDFDTEGTMGIDGNGSSTGPWNTTYYSDGTHPTTAGHILLEVILRPVINGL